MSKLPSPRKERRGSRLECVWYSFCQCVKQVGFEKQQRKRERERERERERVSGELQSVVQFPAFARERLNPGLKRFFNKPIDCCAETYILHLHTLYFAFTDFILCIYRLFANVVRDLLMDWALAEHQILDSRFCFCPTRTTNQPLFILRHSSRYCKKGKKEGVHYFSGPPCCLRQYSKRETLETLAKNSTIFESYHPNHVHRMPLPSY